MKTPISFHGFIQIGIVVEDIEAALEAWCDLFEVPRPEIHVSQPAPNPDECYRGAVANYGLKVAVIDASDRGFVIELHEPDNHASTFREFLDKHGAGVHHLGFEVGDARDAVVEELASGGYPVRNLGLYPGGSWTVVDSEGVLGVNLNIKPHA